MDINEVRMLLRVGKIAWTAHGLTRMQERGISRNDVLRVVSGGVIIEDYPDDYPHPSCLIMGDADNNIVHVVVGNDGDRLYMITAYYPDDDTFEDDMQTRRGKK